MQKILVIEDEPNIRELVTYNLEQNGFLPIVAEDGEAGYRLAELERPDLILLDIMLPGKNGYEICRELRRNGDFTPIIMLTAKTDEVDRVLGLEFGADDYVAKPFSVRELMARVRAVLRRVPEKRDLEGRMGSEGKAARSGTKDGTSGISGDLESSVVNTDRRRTAGEMEGVSAGAGNRIRVNELFIDVERHEASMGERTLELTLKEFDLLVTLARNRGRVMSRDQLLDQVWGFEYIGETRTVDVHIRYLRRKLGEDERGEGRYIQTVRGLGYKMP